MSRIRQVPGLTLEMPHSGSRGAPFLGDSIVAVTFVLALLLPLGVPSGDSPVKGALVLSFGILACLVYWIVLMDGGKMSILAGRLALMMLPYLATVVARNGFLHAGYLVAIWVSVALSAYAELGTHFWRIVVLVIGFVSVIFLAQWIYEGGNFQFGAWMVNKNYLGTLIFFLLVATTSSMKYLRSLFARVTCVAILLVLGLLLVVSSSRAALLATVVFFLVFGIWPLLVKHPKLLLASFVGTLALSILVVPSYIGLWLSPWADYLDDLSTLITGQMFFSGRQYVWPVYMLIIADAPWLGHGFAFDVLNDAAMMQGMPERLENLSAHNQYLMIAVQTGVIGLTSFCILVSGVWHLLMRYPERFSVRIAASAFLAFLLHEIFEVTLLQNNVVSAWPMWMFIGFALCQSRDRCQAEDSCR